MIVFHVNFPGCTAKRIEDFVLFHENLKIRSFSHGFLFGFLLEVLGHQLLFCRLVVYEFHSILDSKIYHTLPETNIAPKKMQF